MIQTLEGSPLAYRCCSLYHLLSFTAFVCQFGWSDALFKKNFDICLSLRCSPCVEFSLIWVLQSWRRQMRIKSRQILLKHFPRRQASSPSHLRHETRVSEPLLKFLHFWDLIFIESDLTYPLQYWYVAGFIMDATFSHIHQQESTSAKFQQVRF